MIMWTRTSSLSIKISLSAALPAPTFNLKCNTLPAIQMRERWAGSGRASLENVVVGGVCQDGTRVMFSPSESVSSEPSAKIDGYQIRPLV